MRRTIAVCNQKGGVGKTTTAVNLSSGLAEEGKRVLLVDMDPQGNSTSGLGLEAGKKTIYECLIQGLATKDAIVKSEIRNLDVLSADIRLSGAELELAQFDKREYRLKDCLESVNMDYDIIIIDCPPSLSLLTINSLVASDGVLIPIQCEYYALEGVASLVNTIERIRKSFNRNLDIDGILLTMFDGRTNLSLQVAESVKKHFKKKVFSVAIPRNVRLGEAPSFGKPINLYDPKSIGAQAYTALARELIKRLGK